MKITEVETRNIGKLVNEIEGLCFDHILIRKAKNKGDVKRTNEEVYHVFILSYYCCMIVCQENPSCKYTTG